jgi:protein-disulfide isomerase
MEEVSNDFKDRVNITTIKINMFEGDLPDTEDIKQLREQYKIYGAPTIIINGKEFTRAYTIDNLRKEICREFLIKPLVCFK